MAAGVIDRDLGWKRIKRELTKMNGAQVKIGVLGDAGLTDDGVSLVSIATWNEYGTSRGIPARPFVRMAFDRHKNQISDFIEKMRDGILAGHIDTEAALGFIGADHQSRTQEELLNGGWAPNAPSTIARKKPGLGPLVHTGVLHSSISYEVEM